MKLSSYLSLVFAVLLSGAAWSAEDVPSEGAGAIEETMPATEGATSQVPQFAAVDKDKSGGITAEEAVEVPGLTAAFPKLDSNADANLSEDEYAIVESGKISLIPGG
ncbi:MAG: hypothetical protein H0T87_11770 [Gammaproteobacteria bacterium]|nr:hypothetical protein [Gammaproteobacteria bacterium]